MAFTSIIISKGLDWATPKLMEHVIFGAFLHDLGITRLSPDLQDRELTDMNATQLAEYKKHVQLGMEMIQDCKELDQSVKQIVFQHHEHCNGEGFPNGYNIRKIIPGARVVNLADDFTTFLETHQLSPKEGIRIFASDKQRLTRYDPIMVRSLIQSFLRK